MHAQRDIVMANPSSCSVCISVRLSDAGIAMKRPAAAPIQGPIFYTTGTQQGGQLPQTDRASAVVSQKFLARAGGLVDPVKLS